MFHDYLKNLERIEFTVTMACTGRCRHCSEGDHAGCRGHIDADVAADAVRKICSHFRIKSLMTFGGEPLLYPDVVYAIHNAAKEEGIPDRQLITNGFFSRSEEKISEVACRLAASGVNDLLLSVDAFHQETIPLEPVMYFAECAVREKIPVELSPAWLVNREDDNPYNNRTREILSRFSHLNIPTGQGNVIFPSGNALKYLGEYFDENTVITSPYVEDPTDVRAVSFSPNGDVELMNGNVYETDIIDLLRRYGR
ncbi:MAG: radical SAM protein [Clostridiales bacterium]|nr:radical SAM protein [Clostridiales bacterium]